MNAAELRITEVVRKADQKRDTGEVLWRARTESGSVDVGYGDPERQFFIASATKLYVTTILAQMQAEGRCSWEAPVCEFLPDLDLTGLLVFDGVDRSQSLRIRDLLAHLRPG